MSAMKIGFYSVFADQMGDRLFSDPNVASGAGDDLLLPFVRLREAAIKHGIECRTADMADINQFNAFVFCEMPESSNRYLRHAQQSGKPAYLIIAENYFIRKSNADRKRYSDFDAVFTYDDDAVDGSHIIKLNYAFDLPCPINLSAGHKEKLAVMICSNTKRGRANLIYAQRRDTIRWFEENHPEEFDLYGLGWDRGALAFQARPAVQRTLRRIGVLRFFPRRMYPSWRGRVVRKRDVLGKYLFGFCYENTDKIPGYITEKMFDVMMAGTVPVYLGAGNTGRHIPQTCFINRADFKDHESLCAYIKGMPDSEYMRYLESIQAFLSGDQSREFSITTFVQTLLSVFQRNYKD
jgi:hypothetical protein